MPKKFPEPAAYATCPRPPIRLQPVESSQVKAIGYDGATKTLAVQFKPGAQAIYHFSDIAHDMHEAFVGAESLGKFFGEHIKDLPFEKFPREDQPEEEAKEA